MLFLMERNPEICKYEDLERSALVVALTVFYESFQFRKKEENFILKMTSEIILSEQVCLKYLP